MSAADTPEPADADVAVVGAGPAGLAAADLLGRHDVDVLVVDEQQRPGGQIYRQPPPGPGSPTASTAGLRLISAATRHPTVRWWHRTTAWGTFRTGEPAGAARLELATSGPQGSRLLRPRRLLLTAGAYDLPVPLPGWTLPGVMTAGGVQVLLKSQRILPGRRFVLAGAHPLLLVVAAQLVEAGADVAEVALAQTRMPLPTALRGLRALPGHLGKAAEGARALAVLRRARVPVRGGTVVRRADGDTDLESVTLASVNEDWTVRKGTDRVLACDTLALGYGFVPSVELALQSGCEVRWDRPAGGWTTAVGPYQRTTVPDISAAGEITGVAGAEQAVTEGRLAAVGILADLGIVNDADARRLARPLHRDLARRRRFSSFISTAFAPDDTALAALADDTTVICRCEEVTVGTVREALRENPHLRSANAVKLLTRTGMGLCQGRSCGLAVCRLIATETGQSPQDVGGFTARAPVKPVTVQDLLTPSATGPDEATAPA
ncbi:NAD(P)/FAD-dependent oxidoreductase [Streptomyces sp. SID8352]|uniref:NAD(P)/FAD-dependent oxidoreductase n=1 Tax=Streptomyces sp. SID8352 TaxID=2690338 RepID=UPI00136DDBDC|nr:FAD-dependent oxidoreductase [Streptomyces sp. SID8352]